MHKPTEVPTRAARVIGTLSVALFAVMAIAGIGAASAGETQPTSSGAATVHLAPYLPRYSPPVTSPAVAVVPDVPVAAAPNVSVVPSTSTLASATPSSSALPTPSPASIAPTVSLSPSETVISPAVPDTTPQESHQLVGGVPVQSQLREWAKTAGWSLIWNVTPDWIVPNDATYTGDFPDAAAQVIKDLAANGADIRGDGYSGNRTFVVHEAGSE
ncbi:TcpQ domain-containing protein [Paraburkholderia megapolitana]|uniref:TcpQ domain-containing protein n=1 Tax=Paraburkholderia megapolitana TaxID=420953 RepID=UPI0038B75A97